MLLKAGWDSGLTGQFVPLIRPEMDSDEKLGGAR